MFPTALQRRIARPSIVVAALLSLAVFLPRQVHADPPEEMRGQIIERTTSSGLPSAVPGALDRRPVDLMFELSATVKSSPDAPLFALASETTLPVSRQFGLPRIGGKETFAERAWDGPRALGAADDAYNVLVIGDSLATGVHAGLTALLDGDDINLIRESKRSTGLVNTGFYHWPERVEELTRKYDVDATVIVVGANDRMNIVHDGEVHGLFGKSWTEIYAGRVDRITRTLSQQEDSAVYWVGLPFVKKKKYLTKYKKLNAIFEARAEANQVPFVSTWDITTDEEGTVRTHYTRGGVKRQLRLEDGVHFTWNGYQILATPVARQIAEDFGVPLD